MASASRRNIAQRSSSAAISRVVLAIMVMIDSCYKGFQAAKVAINAGICALVALFSAMRHGVLACVSGSVALYIIYNVLTVFGDDMAALKPA